MNDRSYQGRPSSTAAPNQVSASQYKSPNPSSHARLSPSRSLTAPRLHTSRSTSSMTTLQSYPSSSLSSFNSFSNSSHTYDPYYFPLLPPLGSSPYPLTGSNRNQPSFSSGAGGHSMQTSRSLGGLTTSSSNIAPSFPSMPSYDMSQLNNLDPQALAHSLVDPGPSIGARASRQSFSSSRTLTDMSSHYEDQDGVYVSPKLIMDPVAPAPSSGLTTRRGSAQSSASASNNINHSHHTQSRPYTASSSGNQSTHSSPLIARNLETTLSPGLFPPAAWELPPALASASTTGNSGRSSTSTTLPVSRRGTLAPTSYQQSYGASLARGGISTPADPYASFASQGVPAFTEGQPPYIPDSGYNTQGRPSPLVGQIHSASSSSTPTNTFHYTDYEALPPNATTILSSSTQDMQDSSSSGAYYLPSRTQSFNNLKSSSQPLDYAQMTTSCSPSEQNQGTSRNSHSYRSRTQQNMQGLLHSDHMKEGFPGEWSSAFR